MNPTFESVTANVTLLQEQKPETRHYYQECSTGLAQVTANITDYVHYLYKIPVDAQNLLPLARPLGVSIYDDAEGSHAENEELSIFGYGRTSGEAIDDFIAALVATWEGLKNASEQELSGDAVKLRRRLAPYFHQPV